MSKIHSWCDSIAYGDFRLGISLMKTVAEMEDGTMLD